MLSFSLTGGVAIAQMGCYPPTSVLPARIWGTIRGHPEKDLEIWGTLEAMAIARTLVPACHRSTETPDFR
ncbi:hypothetical protein [Oxynema aestuarii]|uniref:Uncharacterized protein n=1 Tax=Oxynema aestuarii AP17 TaxID=2064643 RepID=A0A6H1U1I2_9CYAN|nr:hypothetical protein [Oxynema aestuarii]QIZ71479.1 hypothetical protein HCG48_13560 [Oxynema aestuarii AP17]